MLTHRWYLTRSMKIALFSSILPDGHPTSGYEIANEAIATSLRDSGADVTEFGFRLPRQIARDAQGVEVLATIDVENANASIFQKFAWLLKAHITGLPVSAAKLTEYPSAALYKRIKDLGPFDAHVINSYQMAAAFPELLNKPFAYIAHNIEHRSASQNAAASNSMLTRYLYGRDARLLRDLEERLCRDAGYVWTLSNEDLLTLSVDASRGSVLPMVTPWVEKPQSSAPIQYDIGMIGTWTWQPNLVGLQWFIEDVLPHLPKDVSIAVAGSAPKLNVTVPKNVEFIGRVESANRFLEGVYVVPLVSRGGTGVQLKTIEALQAGYATVATDSALRGINILPNNCARADDPKEFARKLMELVEKSRSDTLEKVDGSDFYSNQLAALRAEMVKGMEMIT